MYIQSLKSSTIFNAWKWLVHPQYKPDEPTDVEEDPVAETEVVQQSQRRSQFVIASVAVVQEDKEDRQLASLVPKGTQRALDIICSANAAKHAATMKEEVFRFLCRAQACGGSADLTTKDPEQSDSAVVYPLLAAAIPPAESPTRDETILVADRAAATKDLETALDDLRVKEGMDAICAGAAISTKHIKQCASYLGDAFVPLLNALLVANDSYIPRRLFRDDIDRAVLSYSSPVGAIMFAMHCERWRRIDLTVREIATVENDPPVRALAGGRYQSVLIWRAMVVRLCEIRASFLAATLNELAESRTVDQEVAEVLKAQKIDRLNRVAASMKSILCEVTFIPPPPVEVKVRYSKESRHILNPDASTANSTASITAGKDIFTVLREYTDIIHELTKDAVSLRRPLLDRDDLLLRNGFLKQARADFLRLRFECMSAEERKTIEDKRKKKKHKRKKKRTAKKKGGGSGKTKKGKKNKKGSKKGESDNINDSHDEVRTIEPETDVAIGSDSEAAGTDDEGARSRANSDTEGTVTEGDTDGEQTDDADDHETMAQSEMDADLEAIGMGIVRLKDELELSKDSQWLGRTAGYTNLLFEQWSWTVYNGTGAAPFYDEPPATILERLAKRRIDDASFAMERTLAVMRSFGLPEAPKAEVANEAGISGWIIQSYFADEVFREHFVWQWLPPGYWNSQRVKRVLTKEIAKLDHEIALFADEVNRISSEQMSIDQEKTFLSKFLKLSRSEIVSIGRKAQENKKNDIKDRAAKLTAIKRSARAIDAAIARVQKEKALLTDCAALIDTGEVVKALEALGYDGFPPEKGAGKKRPPDAVKLAEYAKAAAQLMTEREDALPLLEEAIQRNIIKKANAESDYAGFERQTQKTLDWMQNFACERFRVMLDVQDLVLRTNKELEAFEDKKDAELLLQGHIESYRRLISRILAEVVSRGAIVGEAPFIPFDPSDPEYAEQKAAYEEEQRLSAVSAEEAAIMAAEAWRSNMSFRNMQQRCAEDTRTKQERKRGVATKEVKRIEREASIKIPFVHSHLENTLMNMFGGPLADPTAVEDIDPGMLSDRSVSSLGSVTGAVLSQAMDSHLIGFARPPTELSKANMEREAELARVREEEQSRRQAEEKEIRLKIHGDYWSNLQKDDKDSESVVHVDLITASPSFNSAANNNSNNNMTTFITASSAVQRFPNSRTAKMWDRARRSVQGKKSTSNEVGDIKPVERREKEREHDDLDSLGKPQFTPKTRPHRQDPGDIAYRPQFRAKPAVGFSAAEHPDRPTLMAEIAAAKAKELEEAKAEGESEGERVSRRKNEMDVASIITDPFIAFGLSEAKWKKVSVRVR